MGIKGLTGLLSENAPKCMKDHEMKTLFGRKVAIDASMSIYQFLIAVRQQDGQMLMNESGDVTSHLMGFFYRTIRMVDHGIKPCYIFDGKPPELKGSVLAKRFARREEAKEGEEEAKETGTAEDVDKLARRQVRVTREHNEECKKLLSLMGIPVVTAPGEAEAQCAELARAGKVYAAGSEDMDTLTFHSPILLRHLTFSEAKKMPISEIHLDVALRDLEMSMDQFIELCILLGCDYLEPCKGIGPKTALKLMREHGTLGKVVEHIRGKMAEKAEEIKAAADEEAEAEAEAEKYDSDPENEEGGETMINSDGEEVPAPSKPKSPKKKAPAKKKKIASSGMQIPEFWPWEEAKQLFLKPDVVNGDDLVLEWKQPDTEGLVEFLCRDKGFNEDRVRAGAAKLSKMLAAKQQGRLDGFFTVKPKEPAAKDAGKGKGKDTKGEKRKAEEKGAAKKKTKK
ncbi:flap endonuclease 1 [Cryptococcus gattii E566]|uniref:Flap endonuclease 1 n=1 Tax=Cryptococcus gattii serotype B (strain WM276 / ATCC MYA-4071) TaxID=367775 RepID=E6R3P3_CRYGW|nr:flap endonuclease, putative [Cryptococcus gattii WM276]ADV21698.1 flap endonuclease, putative [Cryptococcus gattii WM276]KIY35472.1 flap endonuclease 1 [Cryptococcus gattii E566]